MMSSAWVCLVLLIASCGSARPAAPEEQEAVEGAVGPSPEPSSSAPDDPAATADLPLVDSPHVGAWGCRGPIEHVAMSYRVSLELLASGRFELSYSDVSPQGGRVVRMEGVWETRALDGGPAIYASAEAGSETTWSGDLHREQHRDPDGPAFTSQRREVGVSTAERRWDLLSEGGGTVLRLDPELGTRLGRATTTGADPTWRRCDLGRFND